MAFAGPSASDSSCRKFLKNIEFRVAQNAGDLEQAYALVHKEYLSRGYTHPSDSGVKVSIYNALPTTTTFVAVAEGQVIGTVSLIGDSTLGVPMDRIYKPELDELRSRNLKLAEASMLAVRNDLFGKGVFLMLNSKKLSLVFNLFKLAFDYIHNVAGYDEVVIAVNPKHDLVYRFLFFEELGPLRYYESANGAPAIAKHISVRQVQELKDQCLLSGRRGLYKMFFGHQFPQESLQPTPLFSQREFENFFVQKSAVLAKADPAQLEHLRSVYPRLKIG
ncbi:MAG: hypothetical protein JW937_10265 [Candidatus Omnitrophica bacterium]|nr:hypothetical protein [Candidatus Omnitrophota bacterium]